MTKRPYLFQQILLILILLLPIKNVGAEIIEQIYYLVNEDFITQIDFEEEVELAQKNTEIDFDTQSPVSIMSNLIISKLIENKLLENNLAVKESDVSNYINAIIEKNNLGSIENFISILSTSQNLSFDQYRNLIRRKLNYQYYTTRLISTPTINNRDIEEYYQRHRETEFRVKEPILNLSVVTMLMNESAGFSQKLQIQNRMLQVKEEVQNKKITFEEAVKKYSEDEITKASSGLIGWADPRQLGIGGDSLIALRSLPKGEISDLIRDRQGISIYKVNDIIKEGLLPYDLAIQESKNRVFEEKQKQAFINSLRELIESSIIVAKNPDLKVDFNFSQ